MRSLYGVVLIGTTVGIGLDIIRGATLRVPLATSALGFLAGFALAITAFYALMLLQFVRSVILTELAITFVVGFRRVVVPWGDLVPPPNPLRIGVTFKYRREGVAQENDALFVTRNQAWAILSHPSCPPFNLDRRILASLGV